MKGIPGLPANIPLALFFFLGLIAALTSLIVALDARERGMSKFVAIAWGIAVQMFFPMALVYLFMRFLMSARKGKGTAQVFFQKQVQAIPERCSYCAAELPENSRVCKECGRLV
jgi:hypothetical protein